jgi:hypothetical protein
MRSAFYGHFGHLGIRCACNAHTTPLQKTYPTRPFRGAPPILSYGTHSSSLHIILLVWLARLYLQPFAVVHTPAGWRDD